MSIQNNSLHAFHLLAEIFGNLQSKEIKIKLMWPKTKNCFPKEEPHHMQTHCSSPFDGSMFFRER
jgi:hypothetical protein